VSKPGAYFPDARNFSQIAAALRGGIGRNDWRYSVVQTRDGPLRPGWYVYTRSNRLALKDPLRPVTSVKVAWESVRDPAKVNCKLHDLRHSFCKKLAEVGVPEGTMLDMMGHVSTAMLRRYSHIRTQARRAAIDALESRQSSIGVPTKVSTVAVLKRRNCPQVDGKLA
jgi:integrase